MRVHILKIIIIGLILTSCKEKITKEKSQPKISKVNIEYSDELKQFKSDFKIYTKDFFTSIQVKERNICSFGVFADQDMSSFLLYYNTKEHLIDFEILSEIDDLISIRKDVDIWWIPEWKGSDTDLREPINEKLHKSMSNFYSEMEFVKYKDTMFYIFCEALKELREEGLFERAEDDFLLLVQESGNFNAEDDEGNLREILSDEQWKSYLQFNLSWLSSY